MLQSYRKLLYLIWKFKSGKKRGSVRMEPVTKRWRLKSEELRQEFKIKVMERVRRMGGDVQEWSVRNSEVLRST